MLKFNDENIRIYKDDTPEIIYGIYMTRLNIAAEIYRNSPKGKKEAEDRKNTIITKQNEVNYLLKHFPYNGNLDNLIQWIVDFTENADDVEVKFNKQEVVNKFKEIGYSSNLSLGLPEEKYKDRVIASIYIIGQFMDGLENHGVICANAILIFAERFFALKR